MVTRVGADELALYSRITPEITTSAHGYTPTQLVQIIRTIQETEELLELNVNPRLVLEELLLNIPEPTQVGRQ